jgi:predicted RNase H-like HicB family nuclease
MVQKLKQRTRELTFEIVFFVEPDGDRYHVWSPMLPGLHADGATSTEAIQRAQGLAQLYLEVLIEDGDPIPVGLVEAIPPGVEVHKKTVVVSVS